MAVYTTSTSVPIPSNIISATIKLAGEGGAGAPVSGSTFSIGADGGNTVFLGVTARGGQGGQGTTGGQGRGQTAGSTGFTVLTTATGNNGNNGGTYTSIPSAMPGGTGNPGGDGGPGGVSSYQTYTQRTCGGGFGYLTAGCGFYPACGAGFFACGSRLIFNNCANNPNILYQEVDCCYNTFDCSYFTTYNTRGGGGGEGGYIEVALDKTQLAPYLGTNQSATINAGGSNMNNGFVEFTFVYKPRNPVWVRLSTGWVQMADVAVRTSSGWTVTNPTQQP